MLLLLPRHEHVLHGLRIVHAFRAIRGVAGGVRVVLLRCEGLSVRLVSLLGLLRRLRLLIHPVAGTSDECVVGTRHEWCPLNPASFHTADDLFDVDSIPGVGGEVALPAVLIVASGVRRGGSHRIRCRRRKQSLALELVELSLEFLVLPIALSMRLLKVASLAMFELDFPLQFFAKVAQTLTYVEEYSPVTLSLRRLISPLALRRQHK